MPITNTTTADNAARIAQVTGATKSNDIGSKDVFLKLLVAQMRNQDPLKPQDPTQMSAQLARFNMVEQQLSTNKLLQQIADSSATSPNTQSATAASYLGHQAVINSDMLRYDGTSPIDMVVQADKATQTSDVSIVDANGNVVKTLHTGSLNKGDTPFTWDGTTSDGGQAAAGIYNIQVKAADLSGTNVKTSTQVTGLVEAVRITTGGTNLVVGGVPVPIDTVKEIRL